jgi:hypothetical protein
MILLFTITTPSNYFVVTTPYFPPFLTRFLILLRPKLETIYFEKHGGLKVPSILKEINKRQKLLPKFFNC